MEMFLAYATNTAVVAAVAFVFGVVFSTKIKDSLTGTPATLRTALSGVEAKAKADAKAAVADVISKITPAAPVAPVAPPVAPPKA